jgi:hypothetical protein
MIVETGLAGLTSACENRLLAALDPKQSPSVCALFRELAEMRYLWNTPVRVDN